MNEIKNIFVSHYHADAERMAFEKQGDFFLCLVLQNIYMIKADAVIGVNFYYENVWQGGEKCLIMKF